MASLAGPAVGAAAAALLVVAVAWRAGHRLGGVAQTWDAAYHANLTELVVRTGDSDPVTAPSALASAGWRDVSTYYPDALHALAALGVRLTGAGPATVLDVLAALVAGAVLPVAVGALAGAVAPVRRGTAAAVGAVVAVLPVAAPWDQWWRGVWSYGAALATAVLLAAVAVRALEGRLVPRRPVSAAVAVLVGTAGVAGLQPAGVVLAGALVLGWALSRLAVHVLSGWSAGRSAGSSRRGLAGLGAAVLGALLLPPLVLALARWSPALRSLAAYDYTSRRATWAGAGDALVSVLGGVRRISGGYGFGLPPQGGQWVLAAVVLAAVAVLATSRATAWLAVVWVLAVAAAVATVVPLGPVLAQVVGPAGAAGADLLRSVTLFFYNAPFRLMAVVAVVGAVAVGVGAARAAQLLADLLAGPLARWTVLRAVVAGGAALLAGTAAVSTLEVAAPRLAAGYAPRVTGPDQQAVMDRLAQVVRDQPLPAGAAVANDPVDGSAWLYALHGVPVLFRHYAPGPLTPDAQLLLARLDDVDTDAGVQQALRDLRVCYVYTGGEPVYASMRLAPGFTDLDRTASLEPVARAGTASAYRVLVPGTPCAPA